MSRAKRTDANHAEIRSALRKVTDCEDTHALGDGFPDLVARHLRTQHAILIEVKDPSKPPSARKLTPAELEMSRRWTVGYVVVMTTDEALRAVGAMP